MMRRSGNPILHTKSATVHLIGDQPFKLVLDQEVRTRCGLVVSPISGEAPFYTMTNLTGADLRGTTRIAHATCQKCRHAGSLDVAWESGR